MKKTKNISVKKSSKRGEQIFRELNKVNSEGKVKNTLSSKSTQKLHRKPNYE